MRVADVADSFARYEPDTVLLIGGSLLMQKDLEDAARRTLLGAPADGPGDAVNGEPLGFLCIVDRERDRPVVVDESAAPAPAEQEDPEGPTPMKQARAKTDEQRP